jgi:hypothetical protein
MTGGIWITRRWFKYILKSHYLFLTIKKMNALSVSLDFGVQAYKQFTITFGQSIVQFLCKIGFRIVTRIVAWGWWTECLSH